MTMNQQVLRVGVATFEQQRARALAIVRGEYKPAPDEPRVWFASLESFGKILGGDNQILLELIARHQPDSLEELARLSQRAPSNLSRTLKKLATYGFVTMIKDGRRHKPRLMYDRVELKVNLGGAPWDRSAVEEHKEAMSALSA